MGKKLKTAFAANELSSNLITSIQFEYVKRQKLENRKKNHDNIANIENWSGKNMIIHMLLSSAYNQIMHISYSI